MKIAFVSNYLNHHQTAFCEKMVKLCDEFVFIATDTENIQGYQNITNADYVINYEDSHAEEVKKILASYDMVIFGSTPHELIHARMQLNKLSFLYSERFYRHGLWRSFNPKTRKKLMDRIGQYKDQNMFVLCASAFLPVDLSILSFPATKCFRWGYFPQNKLYDWKYLCDRKKNDCVKIVWVGRLIEFKRPEMAVKVAEYLQSRDVAFELNILGDGNLRKKLTGMVKQNRLEDKVHLVGTVSHESVRRYMEESNIFLFTSCKEEGWGAVLNEAMECGCAPVCCHAIGSVPFLVAHKINGLIFQQNKQNQLNEEVEYLINNPEYCLELGKKANESVTLEWNADKAAERLVKLCCALLNGNEANFGTGPCSKAVILKEKWFRYKKNPVS